MNKLIKMILESKSIEPEEKQERINSLEVMQPEPSISSNLQVP